jgi:hypothetical protein
MQSVWKAGQERMLDVYRATTLATLASPAPHGPVALGTARAMAANAAAHATRN